jgi:hypothetical protein
MSVYPRRYFLLRGAASRQSLPSDAGKPLVRGTATVADVMGPPPERDRVRAALIAAGLSLPVPTAPVAGKLTPEQREELARRLSVGTPLSEIIIEDRGDR